MTPFEVGTLFLLILLAIYGAYELLKDDREYYEWRKHQAAKRRWEEMMRENQHD